MGALATRDVFFFFFLKAAGRIPPVFSPPRAAQCVALVPHTATNALIGGSPRLLHTHTGRPDPPKMQPHPATAPRPAFRPPPAATPGRPPCVRRAVRPRATPTATTTTPAPAGTTLDLFSPSKINLFLRVTARRPDGFHDLASLFQIIDLGDGLSVEALPDGASEDVLLCEAEGVPTDGTNLVMKVRLCGMRGRRGGRERKEGRIASVPQSEVLEKTTCLTLFILTNT